MADVTFRNIEKTYGKNVKAVKEFNLEIADKEFIVLVGPSGCGKSTTLRMVAGLEEISTGELFIGDKCVNDVSPKDRNIAMVFQNYALYPHMTVYENMAFALKLHKEKKKDIDIRVKEAANILGINELLQRKPKELSGGQRQRVAIGRAIVREPQVFLMDEPLSNLDAKLRNKMRAEIIKLRQRINTTFIYVTHDQTEAMTLGDRIVIMKDGLIQQIATPQCVFNKPANLFVAGFIGTPQMNFFNARLDKDAEGYYAVLDKSKIYLPDDKQVILNNKRLKSKDIIIGIRPEHIDVCFNNTECHVHGSVDVYEMMGSSVHLHVNSSGKDIVVIIASSDNVGNKQDFTYGKEVNLIFNQNLIHLFDKETEENLLT